MVPKSGKLTSWYGKYPISFRVSATSTWWLALGVLVAIQQYCPGFTKISQLLAAIYLFESVTRFLKTQVGYGIFMWRRFARWNLSEPQDFGVNKIFQTIIYFRGSSHKRKLVESRWECWKRFGISLVGNSWKGNHLQTRLLMAISKAINTRVAQ